MSQIEMRIADAHAAASTFIALGKLTGSAKVPSDLAELTTRLRRVTGRARPLAIALGRYVETKGFEALRTALDLGGNSTGRGDAEEQGRSDSDAAALVSRIDFEGLDRTAITFAASGLY